MQYLYALMPLHLIVTYCLIRYSRKDVMVGLLLKNSLTIV